MRRHNRLLQALAAASLLVAAIASGTGAHAAADAPGYTTLRPGIADAVLTETVPVQIVLVGRGPDLLDAGELRASFATRNRPIDRMRNTLGVREEIGLEYRYDYTVVHADQAYEDALFAHLASIGIPERRVTGYDTSLGQFAYDEQERNVLDVHDNLVIDAAAAERWLVEHPAPGIDPTLDTAVLLSWWGRSDFRFHDYKVPAEPHTDTGADFTAREDRRVIAWGGTSPHDEESGFGRQSRTWFHDLSAGPDIWTDGWAIDATWGMEPGPARPYVLPPVWEYLLPGGARRPEQLPQDLYVVLRFVAVNLLFTPSPLRTVDLDGRHIPGGVEVDVTVFDTADGPTHLTPAQLQRELSELTGPLTVDVERRPLVGEPRRCIEGFATGVPCRAEREPRGYPSEANPFLVGARDLRHWRDGSAEHEVGAFVYPAPYGGPWLGVSASNFYDETKSGAFALLSAPFVARGHSQTAVLAHELGHHFGLSHPHDGWEPEYEFGYSAAAGGYLYLAWVGDEVSSNMSYLDVNEDFSQFDLDSFRRWRAAAAFRNANAIAADVLASPRASAGAGALADADAAFTAAQSALTAHDYPEADRRARAGYDHVRRAASAAGVAVAGDSRGWMLLDAGRKVGQGGPHPVHPAAEPVSERTRNDALVARLTARRAQDS